MGVTLMRKVLILNLFLLISSLLLFSDKYNEPVARIKRAWLGDRVSFGCEVVHFGNPTNFIILLLIVINSFILFTIFFRNFKKIKLIVSINLFVLVGSLVLYSIFMQYPKEIWPRSQIQPPWFNINQNIFYESGYGVTLNGYTYSVTLYNYTNMAICFLILFNLTILLLSYRRKVYKKSIYI